ncbi:MAG: hypothetical protein JKY37_30030, partial [Nannocystaceae bacterium]|nr:hypothetical protein [Nannocystaceae bacterium]
ECGGILCHSQDSSAGCVCDPGYEWEDPNDSANFECDQIPGKAGDCDEPNSSAEGSQCFCDSGYNWCSDSPDDFTCCVDPDQAQTNGNEPTGGNDDNDDVAEGDSDETADPADSGSDDSMADSTGGGLTCEETPADPSEIEPLAEDCTTDTEGLEFCSNLEEDGPAGSRYWQCVEGAWVEMPDFGDEVCELEGEDFSIGCTTGDMIYFDCAMGPGTDCSGPECSGCLDSDIIQDCTDNRLVEDSCFRICTEIGDGEMTFDHGECIAGDNGPECACCDEGDKDCNVK